MTDESNTKRQWNDYFGPNLGYVQEQYERYSSDPESVDPSFRDLFAELGEPPADFAPAAVHSAAPSGQVSVDVSLLKKLAAAEKLVGNIRSRFPASILWDHAPASVTNGWQAIQQLRKSYTQSIGFEFSHVHTETERDWLSAKAESGIANSSLNPDERDRKSVV